MYRLLTLCAVLLAIPASAADSSPSMYSSHWSVLTGETVGTGRNIFFAQAGFPGISAELLHGKSPTMDLGGIFTFNYGVESATQAIDPELKLQVATRFNLGKKDKFNFGLEIDPGFAMYFAGGAHPGFTIPVNLVAGLRINPQLNLDFGINTGFSMFFVDTTQFFIPIMFGGGVEYFVAPDLAITLNIRMGPVIDHVSGGQACDPSGQFCVDVEGGGGSSFGMSSLIGVAMPISL